MVVVAEEGVHGAVAEGVHGSSDGDGGSETRQQHGARWQHFVVDRPIAWSPEASVSSSFNLPIFGEETLKSPRVSGH